MRNFIKFAVLGLAAVVMSGCGGIQLDRARGVEPKGSAFDVNLYAEYLTLSGAEFDEADYKDSDVFADRAMAAAGGSSPAPEEISARDLPAEAVGDLTAARAALAAALAKGGADKAPMPAAHAQAMYECWMQEQEENFQPEDIAACRAEFEAAMAKLDAALAPQMAAQPAPAPAPMPAKPEPRSFIVFFDFDSAELTSNAKAIIEDAAAAADGMKTAMVVGHTDRAGTSAYNQALSTRRVEAVVGALKAAGLPSGIAVTGAGRGEDLPRVPTEDGVRSAGNRRVEIVLNP